MLLRSQLAPQEQGRCSSGVLAPEEPESVLLRSPLRAGAPQEPGSVLLRSRSQGWLLSGAAISHHPPQRALPCNPDHWVCLGAAHCLTHCPHCGDLNPHHRERPAARAAPPPASHPSFFGPLTDTLRDHLGGYYVADAADHTWSIAVATGSTLLPPHSPLLRHSRGGLNVAARHVLLALYLHHRDLHLPVPQLPAPPAAALMPEALADTAPGEIAAYLRITCRRLNTALARQKGTPYQLSALLYSAHHAHPTQLSPPEGRASLMDAHLAAPDEATATRMGLTDQRAYVRGLKARL